MSAEKSKNGLKKKHQVGGARWHHGGSVPTNVSANSY
jgi:hypothetical protein